MRMASETWSRSFLSLRGEKVSFVMLTWGVGFYIIFVVEERWLVIDIKKEGRLFQVRVNVLPSNVRNELGYYTACIRP